MLEFLIMLKQVYFVVKIVLPNAFNLIHNIRLVFSIFHCILGILDSLSHDNIDIFQSLLHKLEPVSLIPDILQILVSLVKQFIPVNPCFLGQLFVKNNLFLHLRCHSFRVLYLVLNLLVFLEKFIEFFLQVRQIASQLFR